MVRDGYIYGGGLLVVAFLLHLVTGSVALAIIPVILACFFLWFFRDPNRPISSIPGAIVSPADGKVTDADWIETPQGSRLKLSVFLNVFDVHVNRSPDTGVVSTVEYRRGLFVNAMREDAAALNEQNMIIINCGHYDVAIKQIAGLLARRIVCFVKEGDRVERGQRVGLIKFGSRVDILMPAEVNLHVRKGDRVKGGSTILATLQDSLLTPTSEQANG